MENKNYQICTRCVMDTTDPEISFDENGVCAACQSYENIKVCESLHQIKIYIIK